MKDLCLQIDVAKWVIVFHVILSALAAIATDVLVDMVDLVGDVDGLAVGVVVARGRSN